MSTERIRSPFHRAAANFRVIRNSERKEEAEILLYDEIGFFGVDANSFVRDLKAIDAETIHLRINSPGGSVFDGVAIHNALKDHPARIVSHIDSLAASMASVIALAGDEISMAENAFLMIHDPWTLTIGNSEQLRKDADLLDKLGDTVIRSSYMAKTGKSEEEIKAWMADETWFTAEEALAAGFVDSIEKKSEVKAKFDLSVFAKTPRALAESDAEINPREVERLLRDAGMSRNEAKTFVSGGLGALEQRDAVDDERAARELREKREWALTLAAKIAA